MVIYNYRLIITLEDIMMNITIHAGTARTAKSLAVHPVFRKNHRKGEKDGSTDN